MSYILNMIHMCPNGFFFFSSEKHSLQFVGNNGIYSMGKDLVKKNLTFCQIESFVNPS